MRQSSTKYNDYPADNWICPDCGIVNTWSVKDNDTLCFVCGCDRKYSIQACVDQKDITDAVEDEYKYNDLCIIDRLSELPW